MRYGIILLFAIFIFIISACSNNEVSASFSAARGSLDKTAGSENDIENNREPVDDILNEIDKMSEKEKLSYVRASNKPIKVCMFYGFNEAPNNGHGCDAAIFDVTINGVKQEKPLNINNGTQRIVTGISGQEYLVPQRASTVGHLDESAYQIPRTDAPDHSIVDVPGTQYEGTLDENGTFRVNTTCSPEVYKKLGWCHSGIVSFTLIGNVELVYKGYVVTKTLIVRKDRLTTGREEVRNFKELELPELVDNIYAFDDWCNPIEVAKSTPQIFKEDDVKNDQILRDLSDKKN